MATQSSFKQQCPSCEAMVPIRDPKLIGRKIDCPKCKYRFVVEEPVDEVEEAEEAAPATKAKGGSTSVTAKKPAGKAGTRRADDDQDIVDDPKSKKKQGGSGMLIVGIALAAVAVIALAVGGVFLFSGDSSDDTKSSSRPSANAAPKSATETKPAAEVKKAEAPKGPKPLQEDITNLLPNDSQVVINLPMEQLAGHARINQAMLKTPGSFFEAAFQRTWGIAPTDIRRVVWTSNAKKKTSFSVMRTSAALNEKQIVTDLKLKPEKEIEGFKYYLVKKPLDALSTFLLKFEDRNTPVALHFMDSITVICADVGPMTQFLQEKRQPKQMSKQGDDEKPADGAGQSGPPGMQNRQGMQRGPQQSGQGRPGGGSQPPTPPAPPGQGRPGGGSQPPTPPAQGGQGSGQGGKPPMAMTSVPGGFQPPSGMQQGMMRPGMAQGGGNGSTADAAPVSTSYMTVEPDLKAVLDQVEKIDDKEGQHVLLSLAWLKAVKLAQAAPKMDQIPPSLSDFLSTVMASAPKALGVGVTGFEESKVALNFGAAFRDAKSAEAMRVQVETSLAEDVFPAMGLDLVSKTDSNNNNNNVPGSMSGMPGMSGGMMPGGMMGPGMMRGGSMAPGGGKPMPNMPGAPGGGSPPGGQMSGNPPGRPQQGGNFPPMQPQGPPRGYPGMGPNGPMRPGMQSTGDEKKEEKGKNGDYHTWTRDNVAALGINGNLTGSAYKNWGSMVDLVCIRFRGIMSMSDRRSHIHELAEAMMAYLEKEGHFPRGAVLREVNSGRNLDWRPDQRRSWMTLLLPYLANGEFKDLIPNDSRNRSRIKTMGWYDDPVVIKAGMTVIPQFLSPSSPGNLTYFVPYPNLPVKGEWAATHFVGVAGVGLDAAEYRGDDPATAKLRGVFGYDRETKKSDIKDGLDQTIVLIQVPASPKSPWIAGGGSTVRGVSEDRDCVNPFVCLEYQGKRGTLAIMADGKVRFIPANIDPKTFQALCTIAGEDKVRNLDKIAPEVQLPEDPAEQRELKTDEPAQPAAPPESADKPEGWTAYTSKEGGFTVFLPPGKVIQLEQQLDSPAGKITVHVHGIELAGDKGAFVTMYSDFPDAVLAAGADTILDGSKAGFLEGSKSGMGGFAKGAKITSESKITVEGHPGREWKIDVDGKGNLTARVLLVKTRLFILIAGGDTGKVSDKDIQTFFESFQLTGK
jgi:hypothetical protein